MTNAKRWAALAREGLVASSPRAAKVMREREMERARRGRERRSNKSWRWKLADLEAEEALAEVRWATEPETVQGPSAEEIEAARVALDRELALARARARTRLERRDGEPL
ncbi:hypothetical protein ACU635_44050 [[Actinomadura] parvosata]|uniref:hypothetical protein n=1 Tax=[Actinomadura] parvosata TaxID=1955412 RepID=UPI00406CE235